MADPGAGLLAHMEAYDREAAPVAEAEPAPIPDVLASLLESTLARVVRRHTVTADGAAALLGDVAQVLAEEILLVPVLETDPFHEGRPRNRAERRARR